MEKEIREEDINFFTIDKNDGNEIEVSAVINQEAAKFIFGLSEGDKVEYISAVYNKESKDISEVAHAYLVLKDLQGDVPYTLNEKEKLLFKEELIAQGLI